MNQRCCVKEIVGWTRWRRKRFQDVVVKRKSKKEKMNEAGVESLL